MVNIICERYDDTYNNIFDYFKNSYEDVRFISLEYTGNVSTEIDTPYSALYRNGNDNYNPKHIYELEMPEYSDIRYDGSVNIFGMPLAKVHLVKDSDAVVSSVEYISQEGKVYKEDFYGLNGYVYRINYYDNKRNIIAFSYKGDNERIEYICTVGSDTVIRTKNGMVADIFSTGDFIGTFLLDKTKNADINVYIDYLDHNICNNCKNILIITSEVFFKQFNERKSISKDYTRILFSNNKICNRETAKDDIKRIYAINFGSCKKENNKNVLILTNSDQILHLDFLITELKEYTFFIAARTMMSQNLLKYSVLNNVRTIPLVKDNVLEDLLLKCSIYLDINMYDDVFGAPEVAILNGMVVLGFENTIHDKNVVCDEFVFTDNSASELCNKVKEISATQKSFESAVKRQKEHINELNRGLIG